MKTLIGVVALATALIVPALTQVAVAGPNDVIVGVHESKFLRWLVRDRQKSGIKKRYDEAQANVTPGEHSAEDDSAVPAAGTLTPTPVPRTPR